MGVVQRSPIALLSLLGMKGADLLPTDLARTIVPTIDLLQLMAMPDEAASASNAALAEGGNVDVIVPSTEYWLLKSVHYVFVKTATMTAFWVQLAVGYPPSGIGTIFAQDHSPFGATETGTVAAGIQLPWPRLMPPGSLIRATPAIIGTDATVNFGVTAIFSRLG